MSVRGCTRFLSAKALAVCFVALAASACGSGNNGSGDGQQGQGDDQSITLGVLTGPFSISTTLVEARDGMLAEARKLGNVEIKVAVGDGAPAQLNAMNNLIAQQVDGILIDPADSKAIVPGVIAANRAHIPVFGWVGSSEGGEMAGQVSFDEKQGGTAITKWAIEKMGGAGDIALLQGAKAHPAGAAREAAFRTVLSQNPDVKLTGYAEANWLQDVAYKDTQNFLTRDPAIKGIVAFTDEMGLGALQAVKERHLDHPVVITGYNGNCAGLNSVWTNGLDASLYQPWGDAGRQVVDIAVKVAKGESTETDMTLPSIVVDKALMEKVMAGTDSSATEGTKTAIKTAAAGCK